MFKEKIRAFTLIELILIISIIGILSIIGTASYGKARNKALSREAIANLKLIAAAERIYKMESSTNTYFDCDDTPACNTGLKLSLNPTNWTYGVAANGDITVTGVAISGCTYTLTSANYPTDGYTASGCP